MDVEKSINLEESFENDPQTLEDEVMNNLLARQGSKSKASSSSDSRGTKRKLTSSQALYKVLGQSLDKYLNSEGPRVTTESVLNELRKVDLGQIQMLKGVDLRCTMEASLTHLWGSRMSGKSNGY
ncbi:hypothetical protein ACH5RR_039326 [Cinchona calisaya]|uniref:Uncharacterized protein n=1 Tax=Cinchona calisaya TaxID=153742 RepID=A0ABD2XYE9_9GENT